MVVAKSLITQFENGEISVGLCTHNKEEPKGNYKRLKLDRSWFTNFDDNSSYKNLKTIFFHESTSRWGVLSYVIAFDSSDDEIGFAPMGRYESVEVLPKSIVVFNENDFELTFE